MQEARILHCEDSEAVQKVVELLLAIRGVHRVIATAESLADALNRLEDIKDGRLDANVILLDGQLRGGMWQNHPKVLLAKYREIGLRIPIIGLSMDGLADKGLVVGEDIAADIEKGSLTESDLLDQLLDELPEPGRR